MEMVWKCNEQLRFRKFWWPGRQEGIVIDEEIVDAKSREVCRYKTGHLVDGFRRNDITIFQGLGCKFYMKC